LDEVKYLEVFPNPAKAYVILKYKLETNAISSHLQITDASGKVLRNFGVNVLENQIVIDINEWKAGVYVATLFVNGKVLESVKFNIIK